MTNQPTNQPSPEWLSMFQQPLQRNESFDRQRCLQLLEEKRQAKVKELFGDDDFRKVMDSEELGKDDVHHLATLKPADIDKMLAGMALKKSSTFKNLVCEIVAIQRLGNSITAGKLNEGSFESQETIDACGGLFINIRLLANKLSAMYNQEQPPALVSSPPRSSTTRTDQVFEGLPGFFHCPRTKKIHWLHETLMANQYVLITAPPQSGKTCTALLFHEQAAQIDPMRPSIYISFAGLKIESTKDVKDFFKRHTGREYGEFILSGEDTILIVDEAQILYEQEWFWQGFKSRGKGLIYVLAFAIYGSNSHGIAGSPMLLTKKLSFADIAFSREEFDMLMDYYRRTNECYTGPLEEHIRFMVGHQLSSGELYHPGLTVACLHFFQTKKVKSSKEAMQLIDSAQLSSYLHEHCRAFVKFIDLDRAMIKEKKKKLLKSGCQEAYSHDSAKILNECIHQLLVKGFTIADNTNEDFLQVLFKYGFCYEVKMKEDGRLKYYTTCPMIQVYLIQRFRMPYIQNGYLVESLPKFVTDVIKKFDVSQLQGSLSRQPGGLLNENQYVVEFYKKSGMFYSGIISCEVGSQFGLKGRIDIYINHGLNFGVEFIKNGSKLKEHLDRFNETYGTYRGLLLNMKDFIIVDFYENRLIETNINVVVKSGFLKHYLAVLYKKNFTIVEFYKINQENLFEKVFFE